MSDVATPVIEGSGTKRKPSPALDLNVLAESGLNFLSMTLTNPLIFPQDAGYAAATQTLNLRYTGQRPSAIAQCVSADDVAQCLTWCADFDFPFAVKTGGHSYAGYSRTNGLLIDMSLMNECSYDPETGVISVSGGAIIRDVLRTLEPHGRAVTHGRCSTVGVASMVMGGGSGFNMRANGMGCDKVVSLELVTAEGDVRVVTEDSDPELFWACRGGGAGQFGVTTKLNIQTFALAEVTVFRFEWREAPAKALHQVMTLLNDAPNAYGSRVALARYSADQPVVATCLGQFHGDAETVRAFFSDLPDADLCEIQSLSYTEAQDYLDEVLDPLYFHESSSYMADTPSLAFLERGQAYLEAWPETGGEVDFRFFQMGGAVNDVDADATAFAHRDTRWLLVTGLTWLDSDSPSVVEQSLDWQKSFYQSVKPDGTGGSYGNLLDPTLEDWANAYYSENLQRLSVVKQKMDPKGLFSRPQSVPLPKQK
ncbi:6-hydroxy-D-nicotine oxidase [Pelagimonas phthalicica]|uniref:6-hydroxy-D-nicotine oxidase n=1 Tax=Pelagimonas phthalicica TaxID=1037362 RepID=A0A238JE48_9RHOB|nr:FAD-binding oxidoreductase [Pelagimonas phthalicica]TDS91615.1 FAD/FMN-containing dehydrogenase [Pelagimonas phthalicica]SMX28663.1 6-hydroxy-D-nicotine oxidase [Pelagimonas phthalicica]